MCTCPSPPGRPRSTSPRSLTMSPRSSSSPLPTPTTSTVSKNASMPSCGPRTRERPKGRPLLICSPDGAISPVGWRRPGRAPRGCRRCSTMTASRPRRPICPGRRPASPSGTASRPTRCSGSRRRALQRLPPAARRAAGPLHGPVPVCADVPEPSFSARHYTVPRTRRGGFATTQIPESGSVTARIRVPYARLALFAPDREAWELPDGPVTIWLSRSSSDPVLTEELRIPAEVLAATQLPPAPTGRVPADRAEETSGLARSATTLLEGTELRPTGSAAGWADLVLDAGTVVTGVETRPLRSPGGPTARAELIDPDAEAASAAALPLPHTVPAEQGRPTGRVRVRLVGPLALTGL